APRSGRARATSSSGAAAGRGRSPAPAGRAGLTERWDRLSQGLPYPLRQRDGPASPRPTARPTYAVQGSVTSVETLVSTPGTRSASAAEATGNQVHSAAQCGTSITAQASGLSRCSL